MSYIKLSKKIVKWEWYHDINTCRLFIHMLIMANWKDEESNGMIIPRGSFISSIQKLSQGTSLTISKVRTALNHLEMTGEIASKNYSKFTVFTIKNYCQYQSNDKVNRKDFRNQNRKQLDNEIASKIATIEEVKEEKNINNNIYSDDGGVYIYSRAREVASSLLSKYWGRPPTEADVEHVRGLISVFDNGTVNVSEDRVEILEYAFNCSASANAFNWNYILGVIDRLGARGIKTLDEAYSFDVKREYGGN